MKDQEPDKPDSSTNIRGNSKAGTTSASRPDRQTKAISTLVAAQFRGKAALKRRAALKERRRKRRSGAGGGRELGGGPGVDGARSPM
jgi:hypothetical protein